MALRRLKQLKAPATGRSYPLGATLAPGGANFSIFSRSAASIELLFFDLLDVHPYPYPAPVGGTQQLLCP